MTIDAATIIARAEDKNWWRQGVVYQIYPRSFADANGDGVGDLAGITSKVPYLRQLGVDAIWLSPFYPSALKDGGYDVADHRDVDPKIGTLADFDVMVAACKDAGIRIVIDIVPNHTSDDHEWFQAALKSSKGSPERGRYIFRDGRGPSKDEPPNDWECLFGGSAWDPVGDGQYYFHMFDSSQPDLDWNCKEVQDDMLKTLRFWADRGVSGFRVDVACGCAKDIPEDPSTLMGHTEQKRMFEAIQKDGSEWAHGSHPLWDRDQVFDFYKEWRQLFNEYDPPLVAVAEAGVAPSRIPLYASADGLGQSFSFDLLMAPYSADAFRRVIEEQLANVGPTGSSCTWVLSNHDVVRHATRHALPDAGGFRETSRKYILNRGVDPAADPVLGLQRARAATVMMLALPGSAYIYQGEELGLPEYADMPDELRQDPIFFRHPEYEVGRDGCRVVIPWEAKAKNMGFGTGARPHLPQPAEYAEHAVDVEETDADSTLQLYRRAIALRHRLQCGEELQWIGNRPEVVHFRRPNGWEVLMNFGGTPVQLPTGKVLLSSGRLENGTLLPQDTTAWVVPVAM